MSNPSSAVAAAVEIDPAIWCAVAGPSFRIPSIDSYVYYFPQGHLEHYSAAASVQNCDVRCHKFLCKVLSVQLFSNPSSDKAFVKILLQPQQDPCEQRVNCRTDDSDGQNDVVSFPKALSLSDANRTSCFRVPKSCVDSIFPQLDFNADQVQNLTMKDTHNNAWEFRHISPGTRRQHFLTTGWSEFANAKRLVHRDSVVFMKKESTNELFIGIRRRPLPFGARESEGISSIGNSSEALEAIQIAEKGIAFELVYYPRVAFQDFVVSAGKVNDAMRQSWSSGMRVKMEVVTGDSTQFTWFFGTIVAVNMPDNGPWRGSPWRMLQVTWDISGVLQNMNRVSPWQVDVVDFPAPSILPTYHAPPMYNCLQDPGMLSTQPVAAALNPAAFNSSPYPASMQGARRDQISSSSFSNSQGDNTNQTFTEPLKNDAEPELTAASTLEQRTLQRQ